ncbi:MAG: tyrosine-type recombinase/integrase, partial [Pirellulaceae bacterium]
LSRAEVDRLIQCTPNRKHRTFLMVLYSAGMRFSEAAHLRIADIDSDRMMITIAHGKGSKQRLVPLSPRLLKELRTYWAEYRPTDLLFPGNSVNLPTFQCSLALPNSSKRPHPFGSFKLTTPIAEVWPSLERTHPAPGN